ncbi:barstar family protein [Croceibacterium ferulae]|uniref:barstar family protein n=1 Tax=Croceibacterium ferulae TaxID=1854641 RepID=UPI000EAEB978|nr:barstar family protein [Croceibacterium ferulae]
MTVLVLDGATMGSLADLHAQVARHPETPGDHGPNLDALFDVLLAYYTAPLQVTWRNAAAARATLGPDFARAQQVFDDAVEYYRSKGRPAEFTIIEGPEAP